MSLNMKEIKMKREKLFEIMQEILNEYKMSDTPITPDTPINVIDSLDYVALVVAIEERLKIMIPDESLTSVNTFNDVISVVDEFYTE